MIHTIGLDADDTLWHNEHLFDEIEGRVRDLLAPWAPDHDFEARLLQAERANLGSYGFGVKTFILSMVEFACSISNNQIPASDIATMVSWGHEMFAAPVEFLDHVEHTVQQLANDYRVIILTKGDLHHQESKIKGSGLLDVVHGYSVMTNKDQPTYASELERHNIAADGFLMVGNSIPSEILTVVALGAAAAHIPYHLTWNHELHDSASGESHGYHELTSITEVPGLAATL